LRGDEASRKAALSIAAIGGPEAVSVLKHAITEGSGDAKIAAVLGIVELRGDCPDCLQFLSDQHRTHPDEAVRNMIGIMLEVNAEHKH
jgi:hypothetical protein